MPPSRELRGQPASPGFASGPLVVLHDAEAAGAMAAGDAAGRRALLQAAIAQAIAQLQAVRAAASDKDAAGIIDFQIAMLEDSELHAPALAAIKAGAAPAVAWHAALDAQIADYDSAEDAYFRARSADLKDLRDRVLRCLGGDAAPARTPRGAIVFADELVPSRFLELDWSGGGGIALRHGSPSSHVAMLARARGVPMVVGLGPVEPGAHAAAALDGTAGLLVLSPRAQTPPGDRPIEPPAPIGPALTADGERVLVLLNLSDTRELDGFDPAICDGVGVVRTEFLFAGNVLPDEETQYAAYCRILARTAGRPVTVRTLDAGGDKPIPGLTPQGEANPFLGVRGLRLSLARPDVFAVQLRALARAAAHGPIKIMLPMVTVPAELEAARALLHEAIAALGRDGVAHGLPPLGMMVEVPAAALDIARFDAAFLSIGTNDLVQYLAAARRDNAAVAHLADPASPALLRLVSEVARHGARRGIEVSVCGDMAGEPALVPHLLHAGIRVLSLAPNRVGPVKAAIAACTAAGETR